MPGWCWGRTLAPGVCCGSVVGRGPAPGGACVELVSQLHQKRELLGYCLISFLCVEEKNEEGISKSSQLIKTGYGVRNFTKPE